MKTIRINDNIDLHYIKMTKLKTTSAAVFIHRPLCEDEASYNALLPLVLKSGTELCPDREAVAKYLDGLYGATMGGTVIKCGEDHVIYFDAETISDRYAPNGEKLVSGLLELLMSVLFSPVTENGAFKEKTVEQEKINACDKLDAFVNDKRLYASVRCQQETARGTDFAINRLGDKDRIKVITPESLYGHYKRIMTSSAIDIYLCGDADIDEAAEVVRKYIDGLTFTVAEFPRTGILVREPGGINNVTEKMNVTQGKLAMGFLTNTSPTDDDYFALMVFNSLFGAGAHSKLFNNVREKLSLCYYASSQLERFKGIITVNAGIEFKNFDKAHDEILVQLEEIRKGNISGHEFNASVSAIVNIFNSYFDDQRAMATASLMNRAAGIERSIEEIIESLKKVTPEDVIKVSQKLQLDTVYFLKGTGE